MKPINTPIFDFQTLLAADDPFFPDLARDTPLHLTLFQFNGTDLVRMEEIA